VVATGRSLAPPPIEVLDELPPAECIAALGPLFEHAPRFLARLCAARPFGSYEELFERAEAIALAMPEAEQVELVDAHPRLGADPASVSALSFREQGYDREPEPRDAADEAARVERARVDRELARLNEAYEARFGFRFCVFVAGRPRSALVPVLEAALTADRGAELRRALRDVVAIARDRYRRLGAPGDPVG
jgi:2-oxo-4-hydroxy-4-carboxy-5-ureidoimidazoline decarboxylase